MIRAVFIHVLLLSVFGCAASGDVELSAAKSLEQIGGQLQVALEEYHSNLEDLDRFRQQAAIAAFSARLSTNSTIEQVRVQSDVLAQALGRIAEDRQVAWQRYMHTHQNLILIDDIASQLNELGLVKARVKQPLRGVLKSLVESSVDVRDADFQGVESRHRLRLAAPQFGDWISVLKQQTIKSQGGLP